MDIPGNKFIWAAFMFVSTSPRPLFRVLFRGRVQLAIGILRGVCALHRHAAVEFSIRGAGMAGAGEGRA
jgi:hypothetical protein